MVTLLVCRIGIGIGSSISCRGIIPSDQGILRTAAGSALRSGNLAVKEHVMDTACTALDILRSCRPPRHVLLSLLPNSLSGRDLFYLLQTRGPKIMRACPKPKAFTHMVTQLGSVRSLKGRKPTVVRGDAILSDQQSISLGWMSRVERYTEAHSYQIVHLVL